MSTKRRLFFQILTPLVVAYTVYSAWFPSGTKFGTDKSEEAPAKSDALTQLEKQTFLIQMKLLIGALNYFEKNAEQFQGSGFGSDQLKRMTRDMFLGDLSDLGQGIVKLPIVERQYIIATYLEFPEEALQLYEKLEANASEEDARIIELYGRAAPQEPSEEVPAPRPPPELTEEELELLTERDEWFGLLFAAELMPEGPDQSKLRNAALEKAHLTFMKFIVIGTVVGIAVGLSVLSALILLVLFFMKKLKPQFSSSGMPRDYCLEIFCLYLITMSAGSKLLEHLPDTTSRAFLLGSNIVFISANILWILWPLTAKQTLLDVRNRIGLTFGGIGKTFGDIVLAPISYFGAMPLFMIVLIVYSIILQALSIDVSQGAHPIVPVLLSSDDTATIVCVVILAVIVAPLIEEVMFRGALYSWLRERIGPKLSMFISAFIFAAVHPQGVLGLVPLTCIGFFLAFLREWRGNLLTPMIAHGVVNGGTLTLVFLMFG